MVSEDIVEEGRKSPEKTLWAYAYQIVPPQVEGQMEAIRALLEEEHLKSRSAARTWAGRLVSEERVTHILVVTDSPDQSREINRQIEHGLKQLKAAFTLGPPVAVGDPLPPVPTA